MSTADKVLMISERGDLHGDAVLYYLRRTGIDVVRLDWTPEGRWTDTPRVEWTTSGGGILEWEGRTLRLNEIGSVFCRDLFFPKCGSEDDIDTHLRYAEVRSAVEGFLKLLRPDTYWINDPWAMELVDNKVFQVDQAQRQGLHVPRTLVTDRPEQVITFWRDCGGRVVIKQLSEVSLVDDSELLWERDGPSLVEPQVYGFYTERLREADLLSLTELPGTPCLFQEEVTKLADIRVTMVAGHAFAHRIYSQDTPASRTDFRKVADLTAEPYEIPERLRATLHSLLRSWGIEFAACDFVQRSDGKFVFLEANVSGNWLWLEPPNISPIAEALAAKLASSRKMSR